MTATERLRALLDERGVEWQDTGKRLTVRNGVLIPIQTEYEQSCRGRYSTVTEALSGTLNVNNLTPEQAIAATLDDDYERRMDELLCRLTNGKWSKSRSYSVDFMVSCVEEAYDETLERGECEDISTTHGVFKCSECLCTVKEIGVDYGGINYCPDCGKAVRQ